MKNRKYILVICIIISFLLLSSCASQHNKESDEDERSENTTICNDNKNIVTNTSRFYYLSTMDNVDKDLWRIEDGFVQVDDRKFNGYSSMNTSPQKKKTIKNVEEFGIFTYKESENVKITSDSDDIYRVYDTYVSEDGSKTVSFLEGTNIMTFYYDYDTDKEELGEKIDEQQVRKIAEAFISKYLDGYSIEGMHTSLDNSTPGLFFVGYGKKIKGMITDETLQVLVDEYGRVRGFNGRNVGVYDDIEKDITDKRISAAQKSLEDKLNEKKLDYLINEKKYLRADCAGNVYLSISVEINDKDGLSTQRIYIPI